jgi:ribosome maturation factor RimP
LRRRDLLDQARNVVLPVLANLGFDLVELGLAVSHGRRTLRVFIDKPGGVNVEDCARASRAISAVLDKQDLSLGRYYLEVSSPGAERKLRSREDFGRFVGRKALVRLREPHMGRTQLEGRIEGFADDVLTLQTQDGSAVQIPYAAIAAANLCL